MVWDKALLQIVLLTSVESLTKSSKIYPFVNIDSNRRIFTKDF